MYTIIVSIILITSFLLYIECKDYGYITLYDFLQLSFIGIVIGCFAGFVVALMIPLDTKINKYTYEIEALQDNGGFNGSFFLGSGTISGEMSYVFYKKEKGMFKVMQADVSKSYIKYSNENPVAENYLEEPTKSLINNFAIDLIKSDEWIFKIPEGSIKNNYKLDAK